MNMGIDIISRHLAQQKARGHKECMAALAAAGGVSRNTLRSYLLGVGDLRVSTLDAILHVAGYKLDIVPLPVQAPAGDSDAGSTVTTESGDLDALLRAAAERGFEVRLVPPSQPTPQVSTSVMPSGMQENFSGSA